MSASASTRSDAHPPVAALVVYAAAMGWLEGVVVVYIRGLLGVPRNGGLPPAGEVLERMATLPWLLRTEQTREAATLVMLGAVACLTARTWRGRAGAFLIAFGIWDITYYMALFALLRWPPSLATTDLLFLLPVHPLWTQPVWVPVAISCAMILGGLRLLVVAGATRRESSTSAA